VKTIQDYFGTYVGLCPTDESKIAMGEIELTINEQGLKIRHATGITINEETASLSEVRKLSEDEVRAQYNEGSDLYKGIDGFQIGEGAILLFTRELEKNSPRLIVRLGEFIEILGITVLFDQKQIENGVFEEVVENATKQVGAFPFPRLEYNGLHEPQVG
jgi:hypothetical protein